MTTTVFISWSGKKSQGVAEALEMWLPRVIQAVEPFVSTGTQKGIGWPAELHKRLRDSDFGIVCVTSENVDSPWLNFEAGALAARFEEARVAPLLLEVAPAALTGPLRLFQAVLRPDRPQMLQLVESINAFLEEPLAKVRLREAFDSGWEMFDQAMTSLRTGSPDDAANSEPTEADMVLRRLDSIERQLARPAVPSDSERERSARLLGVLAERLANPRATDTEEMRERALLSAVDVAQREGFPAAQSALLAAYLADRSKTENRWVHKSLFEVELPADDSPPVEPGD